MVIPAVVVIVIVIIVVVVVVEFWLRIIVEMSLVIAMVVTNCSRHKPRNLHIAQLQLHLFVCEVADM